MHRLLVAALALVLAGCSFHAPRVSSQDGGDPDGGAPADAASDAAPAARCTTYGYSYNNHKYRLVASYMAWGQAKASCEADGGYLLKIETQAEDLQAAAAFAGGPQEVWTRDG